MRKVNEVLREVVAEEVAELKDPRIGFVTITAVDTAPDLRSAKVYFTVLGDAEDRAETGEALNHAAPRIQRAVGGQVRLKYNPKLRFLVDDAVERGLRMNELLRELTADAAEDAPTAEAADD
jgi:ribosome-binding factor A